MLQSKRNKLAMGILNKLRNKGAPAPIEGGLMGEFDEELQPNELANAEERIRRKTKKKPYSVEPEDESVYE